MSDCPARFAPLRGTTAGMTCTCSAEAAQPKYGPSSTQDVWGLDVYTDNSDICRAARHAGAVGAQGGPVTLIAEPGRPVYAGSTRNTIISQDSGPAEGSFRFQLPQRAGVAAGSTSSGATAVNDCPTRFAPLRGTTAGMTCTCPAEAVQPKYGPSSTQDVWGLDVYTDNSDICRAARHAGVVGAQGGPVTLIAEPGRPVYAGSTRNTIISQDSGPAEGSFRFQPLPRPATNPMNVPPPRIDPGTGQPTQAPIAETLRTARRVQVYINFFVDSAEIQSDAERVLQELLATLRDDPRLRIELIGHTDASGSAVHNLDLSVRRAESVLRWLVAHGIDANRLRSSGRGMNEPIASNATVDGRAVNRRVEVRALD